MSSVTQRIKQIKQPWGGYIKPSKFEIEEIDDGLILGAENIDASIVGMAVDYLTRFVMGTNLINAFSISLMGAVVAQKEYHKRGIIKKAKNFLSGIKGLDNDSIINACKLVTYDIWYRNSMYADIRWTMGVGDDADFIEPNIDTINNIRIMVERAISFFKKYGPIVKDGFTFEPNGYTKIVNAGDGDYLTADTLWDFKVSKSKPTSKQTLQLLMYWIMGQHSGQEVYKNISKLGIFNPRLNVVYLLDMKSVPEDAIKEVETNVICYEVN